MNTLRIFLTTALLVFLNAASFNAVSELKSLDDSVLGETSGQSGVTIEYKTTLAKGSESQPQNNIRWKSNDSDPNTFIEFQNIHTEDVDAGNGFEGLSVITKVDVIERSGAAVNNGSFLVLDTVTETEKLNVGRVNLGNNTALHSVQIFNPSLRAQMEIGAQ
ncbi:DUF6160 family protein [Parendozoicomonas sp. Alg238-R29]|uniref:DUF6160 family protein n=1 Tax=Parendozoicomonas sp. Alg238-R29 TaxID=2993446 RepID=UPI00248DDFF9|nr:DUF6160 family protein [Parendozoicomonas sp. Alg238-R29]